MGFSRKITSLIQSLYVGQESAVRLESGCTEWFPVKKGMRQRCILSPCLFRVYTESIMREVSADYRSDFYDGIRVNGNQLEDLRYADDTALLSDSTSGIDNLIQSVKKSQ